MRVIDLYVTIKVSARLNDGEDKQNALERIAADADYCIKHQDDICEIVDTEIVDVSHTF